MIIFFYRWLWIIATPFVPLYLWCRKVSGKEEARYARQRYGSGSPLPETNKNLIWLHAASVGEVNSTLPVINKLHRLHGKKHYFLLTTSSRNGQEIARKFASEFGEDKIAVRYLPLDHPHFVRRFLHYYRPQIALWVEQELWPNMLLQCQKLNIRCLLLNGRLTEKSARRWRMIGGFAKRLGEVFDIVLAGSPLDRDNFKSIGWQANYKGNLKALPFSHLPFSHLPFSHLPFSHLPLSQKAKIENSLNDILPKDYDFGWLAASLHKGEEAICFAAHNILKEKKSGFLAVAPRYPHEAKYICRQAHQFGLSAILYSELLQAKSDISYECIVIDRLGMMQELYQHFPVCFLGGSCGKDIIGKNKGGHNPLEPVAHDCVVICGEDMRNFSYICHGLIEANVLQMISPSAETLAETALTFLQNENLRLQAVQNGKQTLAKFSAEADTIVHFIGETL